MALIECPECGRQVSDSAAECPECAYPVGAGTSPVPARVVSGSPKSLWWPAVDIFGRVAVGACLMLLTAAETELGAGTGLLALIVAGSALPAWYRHRMERLRTGWAESALVDDLEDRLGDLEHRHQEPMADLEERIEFAERLLTKQREQIGPGPPP